MEGDDDLMPFKPFRFIPLELPLLVLFSEVGAFVAGTKMLVGVSGTVGAPIVAGDWVASSSDKTTGRRVGDAPDELGEEVVPIGAAGTAVALVGEFGAAVLPVIGA